MLPGLWNIYCSAISSRHKTIIQILNGKIIKNATDNIIGNALYKPHGDKQVYLGSFSKANNIKHNLATFIGTISDLNIWSRGLKVSEMMDIIKHCKYPKHLPDVFSWTKAKWKLVGNLKKEFIQIDKFCTKTEQKDLILIQTKVSILYF